MIAGSLAKRNRQLEGDLVNTGSNTAKRRKGVENNGHQLLMEIEHTEDSSLVDAYFDYLDSINKKEVVRLIREYNLACEAVKTMTRDYSIGMSN